MHTQTHIQEEKHIAKAETLQIKLKLLDHPVP